MSCEHFRLWFEFRSQCVRAQYFLPAAQQRLFPRRFSVHRDQGPDRIFREKSVPTCKRDVPPLMRAAVRGALGEALSAMLGSSILGPACSSARTEHRGWARPRRAPGLARAFQQGRWVALLAMLASARQQSHPGPTAASRDAEYRLKVSVELSRARRDGSQER